MATRRAYGSGAVTFEHRAGTVCRDAKGHRTCTGRWRGVASVQVAGKRTWVKVDGQTKTIAAQRLAEKLADLRAGVKTEAAYTVDRALDDWLEHGLDGKAQATKDNYRHVAKDIREQLGPKRLDKLTAWKCARRWWPSRRHDPPGRSSWLTTS